MNSSFGKTCVLLVFSYLVFYSTGVKALNILLSSPPKDSIRSENLNGQRVIIYSVSPGETLYSIARKYQMNPKILISFNHHIQSLSRGQEILIPRGSANLIQPTKVPGFIPSSVITVGKGETMYSIAHSRGFSPEEIMKVNQLKDFSLKLGQKLFIPAFYPNPNSEKSNPPIQSKPNEINPISQGKPNASLLPIPATGLYTVGSGETIYSIGFKYGVGVEELRFLNKIENNEIKIGQVLRLRSDVSLPEPKVPVQTNANQALNLVENPNPDAKKSSTVLPQDVSRPESNTSTRPFIPNSEPHRSRNIPRAFKEEGMGIWIDNTDLNQAKSVALHHLAPVGTVIKVTNPMTKKSIFVKVVGSFPVTEETKNAILVISKSAATLIGALDPHFRVELSYAY
jgi:LysM repeat protein